MRYCPICKRVFSDSEHYCAGCRKKTKEIMDINEPIRLAVVGGTARAMAKGILDDSDIPYQEEIVSPRGVANDIITGYDVKLSNVSLLVPFSAAAKAKELLSSIELEDNYIDPFLDSIKEEVENYKNGASAKLKTMSTAKRTTIKVFSALLLFALIALVVFGTDYIIELIKKLFGG